MHLLRTDTVARHTSLGLCAVEMIHMQVLPRNLTIGV